MFFKLLINFYLMNTFFTAKVLTILETSSLYLHKNTNSIVLIKILICYYFIFVISIEMIFTNKVN